MKYLVLFLILFSSFVIADTANSVIFIENSAPRIQLININLNGEKVDIRIRATDVNGFDDIESVKVKVLFQDNVYEGFGNQFVDAEFLQGEGVAGLYQYSFLMNENDEQGIYTVEVVVKDNESETTLSADYSYPTEPGMLTGAFIGASSYLWEWFKSLF